MTLDMASVSLVLENNEEDLAMGFTMHYMVWYHLSDAGLEFYEATTNYNNRLF